MDARIHRQAVVGLAISSDAPVDLRSFIGRSCIGGFENGR